MLFLSVRIRARTAGGIPASRTAHDRTPGRFCLTANDPLGHRFLRSPRLARNDTVFSAVVFRIAFPNMYGLGDFSTPASPALEMTCGGSDQRERDNRDRPTVTFFNVTVGLSLCHIPSCASVIMILWPYAQESSFYIYNDTFCFFSSLFCAVCPFSDTFFLWMCMMFDILFIHMCTIDCMRGAGRRV